MFRACGLAVSLPEGSRILRGFLVDWGRFSAHAEIDPRVETNWSTVLDLQVVGPSSGRLGDAPMSVDVGATGGRRVVVATRALGPGDWTAMEPSEMLVLESGAVRVDYK